MNPFRAAVETLAKAVDIKKAAISLKLLRPNGGVLCPACRKLGGVGVLKVGESEFSCLSCEFSGDVIELAVLATNLPRSEAVSLLLNINAGNSIDSIVDSTDHKFAEKVQEPISRSQSYRIHRAQSEDGDIYKLRNFVKSRPDLVQASEILAVYFQQAYRLPVLDRGTELYLGRMIQEHKAKLTSALFCNAYPILEALKLLEDSLSNNRAISRICEGEKLRIEQPPLSACMGSIRSFKRAWKNARLNIDCNDFTANLLSDLRSECARLIGRLCFKRLLLVRITAKYIQFGFNYISNQANWQIQKEYLQKLEGDVEKIESKIADVKKHFNEYLRLSQELAEGNLRLVIHIATKYRNKGVSFLDIIQSGNLGLTIACDKFDYSLGTRFSTYATWWIRQSIHRELDNNSRLIRIPTHLRANVALIFRELSKVPNLTIEELSGKIGEPHNNLQSLIPVIKIPCRIHSKKIKASIIQKNAQLIDLLIAEERSNLIALALRRLDKRKSAIVRLRFGIGCREHTLEEISAKFGVTKERIRQIEKRTLTILKDDRSCKIANDTLDNW
jgi:RNA polymerase sigma factor (sigma-70 family)